MGGFWQTFGNNLEQQEADKAKKSPLSSALFSALAGRYGQAQPAGSQNPSQMTQYDATPPQMGPLNQSPDTVLPNPEAGADSQWNQPDSTHKPGQGGGDIATALSGVEGMALGGMAPHRQIARVAESGPENVNGKIISSPSIVALNKGDTVVPLTPHANNKMQPDLLEGHVAAPHPSGEQFSRFQRYGTGRGLMK